MEKVEEGSLYKSVIVDGVKIDIFYGYNSEAERKLWDPIPVFPDLVVNTVFSPTGNRIVRADQDVCSSYKPKPKVSGENWCNDCQYYSQGEEIIGICRCKDKGKFV